MSVLNNPCLMRFDPRPEARVRLLCFPHAGESASAFAVWHREPGRSRRLEWLAAGSKVSEVAMELRLSRRRFITVFTEDVGLTPKVFARITRFQRALVRA